MRQYEILQTLLQVKPLKNANEIEKLPAMALMDCKTEYDPIKLLEARLCNHATFYDLEIWNQRVVYLYVVTVEKHNLIEPVMLQSKAEIEKAMLTTP